MKKNMDQIMADVSPEALDRVPVDGIPVPEGVSADRIREKVLRDTGLTPSAARGGILLTPPAAQKQQSKKKTKWVPWAVSAACFVLIGATVLTLLPRLGGGRVIDPVDTTPSGQIDDPLIISHPAAPWTDGSLSLLTVTYRGDTATAQRPGLDSLSVPDEYVIPHPVVADLSFTGEDGTVDEPASGVEPVEPVEPSGCEGENCTVSLVPGTKITDCAGGRLIRVRLAEGQHAGCEGVYYDAQKDEAVCMSCLLRDMMGNGEEYIDACIRSLCEDCLLTNADLASGEVSDYYGRLSKDSTAPRPRTATRAGALLTARRTLTVDNLGLTDMIHPDDTEHLNEVLRGFKYPVVRVLEYGTDLNKCVFMLCSGYQTDIAPDRLTIMSYRDFTALQMPMAYGIYLADLSAGTVTRIDGSSIDRPWYYSHEIQYMDIDLTYYDKTARLLSAVSDFTGVSVNGDYSELVVTLPWQHKQAENVYVFGYADPAVVVIDCKKGGFTVSEHFDSKPVGAADVQYGVVNYTGADGRTHFLYDGHSFSPNGSLARIVLTDRGVPVIIMRDGDAYRFYTTDGAEIFFDPAALPENAETEQASETDAEPASGSDTDDADSSPEDAEPAGIGTLDVYNRTVMEGGVCVDVVTGSRTVLWEGEADVTAQTPDGRFVYRWSHGDDSLICVDTAEGLVGSVSLSAEFLAAAAQTDPESDHFLLFTNTEGTSLLLTWYHDGTLTFDRQAFMTDKIRMEGGITPTAMLINFRTNLKTALEYLRIDGKPVTVRGISNIETMAKLFSLDIFSGDFTKDGLRTRFADIVESVMPYMDYSGQTVEITEAVLSAALNGLSAGDVDSRIQEVISVTSAKDSVCWSKGECERLQKLINDAAADEIWRLIFGYWPKGTYTEDAFYAAVNEGLDETYILSVREEIRQRVSEVMTFTITTRQEGSNTRYTFTELEKRPEKLYVLARELVETYTGMTWGEFISASPFLHRPWAGASFVGRTDDTMHDVRWSQLYMIDADEMGSFLSGLTFEEGSADIHVRAELDFLYGQGHAGVHDRLTGSIAVGYDKDGQGWAVSNGWRALLSADEVEAFAAICKTEKTAPWMRNAETYYNERH